MIPWRRINNTFSGISERIRQEPYLLINFILAGMILLIFAYSGYFSPEKDDYPVACVHEQLTGEPCVSCGISHSFSLIIRGRISEAYDWNTYGLRVFIFFAAQLLMRTMFSIFYIKHPETNSQLILYDVTVSAMLFIVCFMPFIESILKSFKAFL